MNETIKIWLEMLLDKEIEESFGTMGNERISKAVASSDEERKMHQENIDLYNEYVELLKSIKYEYLDKK